jgi:exodeoxyribonuclease VII small subunit
MLQPAGAPRQWKAARAPHPARNWKRERHTRKFRQLRRPHPHCSPKVPCISRPKGVKMVGMAKEPKKTETAERPQASFEENLKRLEEIVSELEQGAVPLDKALKLYEEGISAFRTCQTLLRDAECKVKKLVETLDGELKEEDFEAPDEDDK